MDIYRFKRRGYTISCIAFTYMKKLLLALDKIRNYILHRAGTREI